MNQNNIHVKLVNLHHILKHIRKLKPKITTCTITFDDIVDAPLNDKDEVFEAEGLEFRYCTIDAIRKIMTWFHPSTKVFVNINTSTSTNYTNDMSIYNEINIDRMFIHGTDLHTFIQDKSISKVNELTLQNVMSHYLDVINLSNIDVEHNTNLTLVVTCVSATNIVDVYKVTEIFDMRTIHNDKGLYKSYLQDIVNNNNVPRLSKVFILYDIDIYNNIWLDIVNILPHKNVMFVISPRSPKVFAFIEALKEKGIVNIQYYCMDMESYLGAKMSQYIFPEYKFDIYMASVLNIDEHLYCTIGKTYGAMTIERQQEWYPLYKCIFEDEPFPSYLCNRCS